MAQLSRQDLGLQEKHIFDEFRPLKLLGEGTFGAVWVAVPCRQQVQNDSGACVALRSINVQSFKKEVSARGCYLGREVAMINMLEADPHANIVRPFC